MEPWDAARLLAYGSVGIFPTNMPQSPPSEICATAGVGAEGIDQP